MFFDPFFQGGDASVEGERRECLLGYSSTQRLLVVVYEQRQNVARIISARLASRAERKLYEQDG